MILPRSRASLTAHFGGLPRAYWTVWTGVLITRTGAMVVPFLALFLSTHRHLSVTQAGLAVTALGLGNTSAQFVGGALADVWGRRRTFLVGPIAAAVFLLGLGYVHGFASTLALAYLSGVALQLYQPASGAIVADAVPAEHRPRAYGLLFWAVNVGFSIAAVLGGALARLGYAWLFWIDSLTCLAFGLLVYRWLPQSSSVAPRATASYREVFADRVMLAYVALLLLHVTVQFQINATLPLAMSADGFTAADFGLAAAVNGVLVVVVQPFVLKRLSSYDRSAVVAAGALLIGLGYGTTVFAHALWSYAATIAVWTLGEIAAAAVVQSIVIDLSPPEARGRYLGLFGAAYSVAAMVAPLWGTAILSKWSATTLWMVCFVLGTAAATGQLALGPRIRARQAAKARAE